jgi:hypothetical protein
MKVLLLSFAFLTAGTVLTSAQERREERPAVVVPLPIPEVILPKNAGIDASKPRVAARTSGGDATQRQLSGKRRGNPRPLRRNVATDACSVLTPGRPPKTGAFFFTGFPFRSPHATKRKTSGTSPNVFKITDTSEPGTHTIEYVATDQSGLEGTATRTVNVHLAGQLHAKSRRHFNRSHRRQFR